MLWCMRCIKSEGLCEGFMGRVDRGEMRFIFTFLEFEHLIDGPYLRPGRAGDC